MNVDAIENARGFVKSKTLALALCSSVKSYLPRHLIGFFLVVATPLLAAQQHTVESVASDIARQHNANAKTMLDDMTLSTSAKAVGKKVVFTNVLKVKRGLPPNKLAEFKAETYKEIVPRACQVNAQNEAFKKGLSYTFIYHNTYGEKLAEFVVDKLTCEKL